MNWNAYARLQALASTSTSIGRGLTCEGAANRELDAMAAGNPRKGTVETALANEHKKLDHRAGLLDRNQTLLQPSAQPSSTWAMVERLLEPLTGADRALLMATAAGETNAELADRLRTPVGTVKSRISRARAKVRKSIQ